MVLAHLQGPIDPLFYDYNVQTALRTMWAECRNEPFEGQRAVAHVILNRLKARKWGNTLASVCRWPKQFSCWNDSDPQRMRMDLLPVAHPGLLRMFQAYRAALHGPDITHGALHYHADYVRPPWADLGTVTLRVGRHIFYRDVP
jgi:N-acetylmuramoyl-L-alanine amidase